MPGCCLNRARLATKLGRMPDELVWTEAVRDDLLRAASAAAPGECAAVLGGEPGRDRTAITELIEVPNAARSDDAFVVDPADFARAQQALEGLGAAFVGEGLEVAVFWMIPASSVFVQRTGQLLRVEILQWNMFITLLAITV